MKKNRKKEIVCLNPIFIYCCPIKLDNIKKVWLGYSKMVVELVFLYSKPPYLNSDGSTGISAAAFRLVSQSFSGWLNRL